MVTTTTSPVKRLKSCAERLRKRKEGRGRLGSVRSWLLKNRPTIQTYEPKLYKSQPSQHRIGKYVSCTRHHAMLTRAKTTSITRAAVLNTYELLETILKQLPVPDLIKSRLVSKTWNYIIIGSNEIQQKMFLRAVDSAPVWLFDKRTTFLCPYSYLDAQRLADDPATEMAWLESQCRMRPAVLNPLLCQTDPEPERPSLKQRAALCESIQFTYKPNTIDLYEPNIYKAMFLCQPPTCEVHLQVNYRRKRQGRKHFPLARIAEHLVVKNSSGIRLGDVLHAFRKRVLMQEVYTAPAAEYEIELAHAKHTARTAIWMLGAIFVNKEEYDAVQRNAEKNQPSPLAKKMMSREKPGIDAEHSLGWWSQADNDWVAAEEKKFGRPALGY